MLKRENIAVTDLALDLANYRTIQQESEEDAIAAMISTSPDRFWALMESLLEDGFLPTESILVLEGTGKVSRLIVKEGNRRVAALKLIHGLISARTFTVPAHLTHRISDLSDAWRDDNNTIPCVVYAGTESETVDRIITLAHGKGEKAGRDQWNAVARARHNRDAKGVSEAPLDLLEKWLEEGRNHTREQAARWAGDYPITVLEEAMKRLAPRFGMNSARALADAYPDITDRDPLEEILKAIGLKQISFDSIRRGADFGVEYGIPAEPRDKVKEAKKSSKDTPVKKQESEKKSIPRATRIDDPRTVKSLLRKFNPRGSGREKVVQLLAEARRLKIGDTPLAFCFVLRSMFEISAKAYCADHARAGGPSLKNSKGEDKALVRLLQEIVEHLTNNKKDKEKLKELHGAIAELAKPEGLLSVTSMNQLVHNPNFVITSTELCVLFGRVFPLLEMMNA